jgi:hypothetical protein
MRPYATRVLVRRPARARRASGTVWVEMLNPSNLFDLNIGWALTHRQYVRDGDAWVGITAKPVAIRALKTFDPARYGSLSFANPLAAGDPRNCAVTGDSTQAAENGLVWDVNSQVAAWIRSAAASNPFRRAGRKLRVYGFGYSQTGGYLATYVGALHRRVTRENGGRPLFDAYLIGAAGGAFVGLVGINQCAAVPPLGDRRFEIPQPRRPGRPGHDPVGLPRGHRGAPRGRRPARGTATATTTWPARPTPRPTSCYYAPAPPTSRAPAATCRRSCATRARAAGSEQQRLFDALARNLDRWVRRGIAPPPGRTIAFGRRRVLDRFGNVVGGVRSPGVDVPISTWSGTTTGPGFCGIAGAEHRFSAARLRALYPTHGAYVRAVGRDARRLQHSRY